MRWENTRLAVGPHGLQEIHTYPVFYGVNPVVQFMGNREEQLCIPVAVIVTSQPTGSRMWACTATFDQGHPDANRKAARDWLLDMMHVWAKEDES